MTAGGCKLADSAFVAVAFHIYDLDNTGWIEPGEIKRFLAALLQDNPAITLSEAEIDRIVDQVRSYQRQAMPATT